MTDTEQLPPARRRRPRERGQGQRGKRVNLRLSDAEHDALEAAAARHGQSLAGYVGAAALSAARDELPADAREAVVRVFAMQRDVVRLYKALKETQPGELADAVLSMRQTLEEAAEGFANLSRKARGMRAIRSRPRVPRPVPEAAEPAPPVPQTSATAREWTAQLAELARQLEAGGKLTNEHWHHRHLYDALMNAFVALGHAHPGGIERLQPRR
ncbi:DUF1778 domain-containing protein [Nonomuraea sp. B19D2]|uniref:type II toxin -antitoxin system TacA 1-like antitoxin n=1 Tax=Nonomuraea sp. B19D2 TaxID=3159561 RepID=UPI0032DAE850